MKNEILTILVVDDESEILKLFRDVFVPRGWRVFTVPTGVAALAIIEKEKIDVVLLDIRLPGTSGLDILKEIKLKYPGLPVVMITALGYEDELVNEALALGAAGYVSKSVPIREVIGAVNNALAK